MSIKIGREAEDAEIWYEETFDAVRIDWKRETDGEEFREALQTGLRILKEQNATNWLGDRRKMGPVSTADKQWVTEEWLPEAVSTPLTQIAAVQPERYLEELGVEYTVQKIGDDITLKQFDNPEDPKQWFWVRD